MSSPSLKPEAPADAQSGFGRRIAISLMLGAVIFLALWFLAFSVMTSLIIGSGASVVIVAASASSDLVETVLDAIGAVVTAMLAAIAAVLGALFSAFGA